MREIKFRAWEIRNKKMFRCVDRIDWLLSGEVVRAHCCLSEIETIILSNKYDGRNFILMQYTGLKDKNEKEIYEGDIIRFRNFSGTMYTKPVVWNEKEGAFLVEGTVYFTRYDEKEVIGNIYETPELLNA